MAFTETTEPEPLVTPKEMADLVKVSEQTLAVWRKRKLIPFVRIGNVIRYNKRRVLKALDK
jgi:excisionase family DNA binding protein